MIMHTSVTILLEFGHCNGTMDLVVKDRHGTLDDIKKINQQQITLNYSIALPNQLVIHLTGKNYTTDTHLDNQGNIVNNKFVKLQQLWLGNIELNPETLIQVCEYQTDRDSKKRFSTLWDCNGTVTMDFFDKTSTEFLLHLNNKILIPITQ